MSHSCPQLPSLSRAYSPYFLAQRLLSTQPYTYSRYNDLWSTLTTCYACDPEPSPGYASTPSSNIVLNAGVKNTTVPNLYNVLNTRKIKTYDVKLGSERGLQMRPTNENGNFHIDDGNISLDDVITKATYCLHFLVRTHIDYMGSGSILPVTEQRNLVDLNAGFTEPPSATDTQSGELLISSPKPDIAVASGHSTVDVGAHDNHLMAVDGPEHIPSFSPSMTGCIAPAPAFSQNLARRQDIISGTSRHSNAPKTAHYSPYPTSLASLSPSSPSPTSPSSSFLPSSSSSSSGSTSFVGKSLRAARQSSRRNKKAATVTIISTPEWLYCSGGDYKLLVKRQASVGHRHDH